MTAELHDDDHVPERTLLTIASRAATPRQRRVRAIVLLALGVILFATSVFVAFRRASDDLASARRDTATSETHVRSLTSELATATTARDRSRRAAALAKTALEEARTAHLREADRLAADRADLDAARRAVYVSLVDANRRSAQLAALQSCLDGVSQALNRVAVGDVVGWQRTITSIDGVCKQAQAATA